MIIIFMKIITVIVMILVMVIIGIITILMSNIITMINIIVIIIVIVIFIIIMSYRPIRHALFWSAHYCYKIEWIYIYNDVNKDIIPQLLVPTTYLFISILWHMLYIYMYYYDTCIKYIEYICIKYISNNIWYMNNTYINDILYSHIK